MSKEFKEEDFRYIRTGRVHQNRTCDKIVDFVLSKIEVDNTLPPYWRWSSSDYFVEKYGQLGDKLLANTNSYQLYLYNGQHVFRIWTDSAKTCIVDLSLPMAQYLATTYSLEIQDVPESVFKKTKPLTKRTRINTIEEAEKIISAMRYVYGLDFT